MPNHYRADIDGLRAIAVVSVLMFHLGIETTPGGFVGVDIFFVISGYLISKIIFDETAGNRFSIVKFYERRFRRIIPAFLFVSILTSISAYLLLFPSELVDYCWSLIYSVIFSENIYLYYKSGYFSPTSIRLPLLHYWSLGVEEQFYVFFPIMILSIRKFISGMLSAIILICLLVSFLASAFLTRRHPDLTFYLLPFRTFELLIGSILALAPILPPKNYKTALSTTFIGLCAMAAAILFFDNNLNFPGFEAALPCVGTAFAIWGGTGRRTVPTQLLGSLPFRLIGKISYSLYLVHWPVIVFGLQLFPTMNASVRSLMLTAISIVIAILSFRFVEQPVRLNRFWMPRRVFQLAGFSILLVTSLSVFTILLHGYPDRFNSRVTYILSFLKYDPTAQFREGTCFLRPEDDFTKYNKSLCMKSSKGHKYVLLWGDSTAADQYSGLAEKFQNKGYSLAQATASACAPILDYDAPSRPNCREFNDYIFSQITFEKPNILILAAKWILDDKGFNLFAATLKKLKSAGINVVVVGPPPFYKAPIPRILANRLLSANHSTTADDKIFPQVVFDDGRLAAIAREVNVNYVSLIDSLCMNGNCPLVVDTGDPLDFDEVHFSIAGSRYVADRTADLIMEASRGRPMLDEGNGASNH